ncbi:MAG: DUF3179 domain-containing protein [Bacteroidetes bacterium]|nr:DUF3179 domain-containing protein [Bacteroidota bacterium]
MQRFRWYFLLLGWPVAIFAPVALSLTLMPIAPGWQEFDSVGFSYFLYQVHWPITVLGVLGVGLGTWYLWKNARWFTRVLIVVLILLMSAIHVITRTKMSAESMFNEPSVVKRTLVGEDVAARDTTVYLWVECNHQLAGYPLDLVAHHHKIQDTVGGIPVLVTYCTMCHTGRVYSPIVNGVRETFRLVGANHYNAMFEDATTGSWWYQATGEAMEGPLKGSVLTDLPFAQCTMAEMLTRTTTRSISIFQADAATGTRYKWSHGYAYRHGDTDPGLNDRTIVIGIVEGGKAKAYPLRDLVERSASSTFLVDSIDGHEIVITLPRQYTDLVDIRRDSATSTVRIQPYQEYWHSWKHFHPTTTVWTKK